MNLSIQRLVNIANKQERTILGLMSGTSLDGLDLALCRISGNGTNTLTSITAFETIPYTGAFREEIRCVFSKPDAPLEKICLLNAWVGKHHASLIRQFLHKHHTTPDSIDLIASHGQTIYHAPYSQHGQPQFPNATLQIGDGDHIAIGTGIITISDFRQKHIAAGGEGAPLAVYGDYYMFSQKDENRIMLNIGGIANFTFLSGNLDPSNVFCTDTGTGNTLMDAYMRTYFNGLNYDKDASIARSGSVAQPLLTAMKQHPFFKKPFPKTTGPELFNLSFVNNAKLQSGTSTLSHQDTMATLNRFSAETIAEAIRNCLPHIHNAVIYTSGGGMHNPLLMEHLIALLPDFSFRDTASLQIHPDAKEAVLFAVLANECVCGNPVAMGKGKDAAPAITMGKISFPY